MQNQFVIITNQRSGSNMLVSMLNGHPDIKCFGELMRVTPDWMRRDGYRGALTVLNKVDPKFKDDRYRFSQPEEFVAAAFRSASKKSFYGFKLLLNQHKQFMKELIKHPDWKIIILRRENILAQYSSLKIAKITGQGNVPKGTKVKKATAIYDSKDFKKFLNREQTRWAEVMSVIEQAWKKPFIIEYTQLLHKSTHIQMLKHIGVEDRIVLEPKTEKRNSSNILSRFANTDKVAKDLRLLSLTHWALEEFQE